MEWIIIFALLLGALTCLLILFYTIFNGISPMPSSMKAKKQIAQALQGYEKGVLLELGSGWGGLARHLARTNPGLQVIGYENSPLPYVYSKSVEIFSPSTNLELCYQNFFTVDLSKANVIICYLCPSEMHRLADKFCKELKPGTIIISNTFALPGWKASHVFEVNDLFRSKIYLYYSEVRN